jgi:membrane-associated phospholipid phosphatase
MDSAFARIPHSLRALWREKLWLAISVNGGFMACYVLLQHVAFFPVHPAPVLEVDRWIPFWPESTVVYMSLQLFMPLGPLLINRPEELARYRTGLILQCLVAISVFLFWPTEVVRPRPPEDGTLYWFLNQIDGSRNAIPSLHAAMSVFGFLWARRTFPAHGLAPWLPLMGLWALAILGATLTTRSHYLLDILVGGCLALICFQVASKFSQPR